MKYRPSNGMEGWAFVERWCCRCTREDLAVERYCDIGTRTQMFGIDDPEYPVEWVEDADGNGMCTAFEEEG